jgi:hypothetical protein
LIHLHGPRSADAKVGNDEGLIPPRSRALHRLSSFIIRDVDVVDLFSGSSGQQLSWLANLTLLPVGRNSESAYRYATAVSRRFEFVHRLASEVRREALTIVVATDHSGHRIEEHFETHVTPWL